MSPATQVRRGFDRAAWQRLAARSLLHSADWLEVMASRLPGAVHTFVHGGEVGFVGAVVEDPGAYETFNPHAILFRDPPVFELDGAERRRPRLPRVGPEAILPALVLAMPGYLGDPAGTAPDDPRTPPAEALDACLAGILDWSRGQGLRSVCCLYTQDASAAIASAAASFGGSSFPLTTRWVLPVWWEDWEAYLAGFGSSRRRKIRRELRAAAAAGVRPARLDPREHVEAIVDGRCTRLSGYGHEPDRAAERRRLEGLLETFAGGLTGYGALRGSEVVGSILCVERGRTVHVLYSGTTEAGLRLPFTHFVASYYAPARHLGRGRAERIDYGIDHGSAKAFRGCRPVVLQGHAVGLDRATSDLVATAAALLRDAWLPPAAEDAAARARQPAPDRAPA